MATNPSLVARRKLLGAAIETTKGTAETLSAALSATIVYDLKIVPVDLFADGQRLPNLSSSGSVPRVKGPQKGKATFKTEMAYGDGFLTLITGCGFVNTSGVCTPTTDISAQKTLTLCAWEGGRKKILHGAMGTCTLSIGGTGQRLMCEWEFDGIFNTVVDQAMPSFSPILTAGYRAASVTFTIASAAIPPIDDFTLKTNSDVQMREDITKSSGIGYFIVGDVVPTLTLAPEARTVANYDVFGKLLAGTAEAVAMTFTDSTGNTFAIAAPKAQRISVDDDERGKKLVDPIEMDLHVSSGNDSVTFTSTVAP